MTDMESKIKIRTFEIIISLLVTISISLSSWALLQIVEHGKMLAAIQGNRFTAADGLQVWREISAIREQIARLPTEFPPKWFADRVTAMDSKMDKVMERLQVTMDMNRASILELQTTLKQHMQENQK